MRSFQKIATKKPIPGGYESALGEENRQWGRLMIQWLLSAPVFWLAFFVLLAVFLQKQGAYHFFYIEQEQLFLYNSAYMASLAVEPGGVCRLATEWLVQFFIYPHAGAWLLSGLLTLIGMFTAGILRNLAGRSNLFLLGLLPVTLLLYVHFDTNYYYQGTVAFLWMLISLYGCFQIQKLLWRVVATLVCSFLLFWWAGPVAFLFAICVFEWELLNRFSRAYGFILPLVLVVALSMYAVFSSTVADYRFILLPDGYFIHLFRPGMVLYWPWICLPALLLVAFLMRKREAPALVRKWTERGIELLVLGILFGVGQKYYMTSKSDFYKQLDYYMRTQQWEAIVTHCRGDLTNYLYKCCLNVALAEQGELGNQLFAYDQQGEQGLCPPWNRITHVSFLLSDVYFSMGHVALSQRMAFEANVSVRGYSSPRMLQRLVQTNLIYGAYAVAEKYLALLEQTKHYGAWAAQHRVFLWNDEAVDADAVLGAKKRGLLPVNRLTDHNRLGAELLAIAEQNPHHPATIEYAGALFLLQKDLDSFRYLIETYGGTAVLPVLPRSFQEAVIILSEQDPTYWERFHVPSAQIRHYGEYRKQVLLNKGNQGVLPQLLRKDFGDTYWYYFMFN